MFKIWSLSYITQERFHFPEYQHNREYCVDFIQQINKQEVNIESDFEQIIWVNGSMIHS